MITNNGKVFLKRYLGGQSGQVVGAISVGIGNAAAALTDSRMQFEFGRAAVDVIQYDFENDRLVFKGTLDTDTDGIIHEVGLWTAEINTAFGSQESRLITSFDSEGEDWSVETFTTANTRIGADSLLLSPAASGNTSSVLTGVSLDLGDYSSQDSFVLAYNVGNANTASVRFRLRTDASNYYEYVVTSPTAGYKFSSFNKGSATVVGTPNWSDINEVFVRADATAGGAAAVSFDGLRIEDIDTVAPEYGLIARFVPAAPVVKSAGIEKDIEYTLPVNI